MVTGVSVLFTTTTEATLGQRSRDTSVLCLSGTTFPPRHDPSWVITTRASASRIRSGERIGGKPAEHHGVDGADPGTGEHRHRQFGDHPHVDGHPVALLHTQAHQGIGEPANLGVEVTVGESEGVPRLPDPVIGHLVAVFGEMAVETVVGEVEFPILEPLVKRRVVVVEYPGGLGEPVDSLGGLGQPEIKPRGVGLGVDALADVGLGGEFSGREGRSSPRSAGSPGFPPWCAPSLLCDLLPNLGAVL